MKKQRSIFEEVDTAGAGTRMTAPAGGLIDRQDGGGRRALRIWLAILFGLVVLTIAVGGLTRLTDSGLSITEWNPLTGAFPPLSEAVWLSEFQKYQASPEYLLQNEGMSLGEFKFIYWWEWGHRQIGRLIGLVWAVGFFGFWAAGRIPKGYLGRFALLGLLGGLQGAIGWWMVSSGLVGERTDVASYRLATHLGLAFVILGLIAWYSLRLGRTGAQLLQARRERDARLFGMSTGLLHLAFLQILLGALVAGIDAGRNYIDWPLMAGGFLPPEPLGLSPLWRNFFENDGLVQFIHRMTGYLLAIYGVVVWRRGRKSANDRTRRAFDVMGIMVLVQVGLGIVTVIYGAPWQLGILHQLGAVALWVLILNARFNALYPHRQTIRGARA